MWTIPEVYTAIPDAKCIDDYTWHIISFQSFNKLNQINSVLKSYDSNNFLWIPAHEEYKRLQSRSNQVIVIDKPNYPNYGFLAVTKDCRDDLQEICAKIDNVYYATILDGSIFNHEIKQAIKVAHTFVSNTKKPKFISGSSVLITSGAFYGMIAKVMKVEKLKAYLEIPMGQNAVQIVTSIMDIVKSDEEAVADNNYNV